MKILYIGPYRNELSVGYASRNIISSLVKDNDLTIRNIYIQNNNDYKIDNELLELENKNIESHYDIIVQHSTPYLLASCKNTGITNKNVAIPILNKTINKKQYHDALSSFDELLTDDEILASILKQSYGCNNINTFKYDIDTITINNLNLDIHNQNKKFYFIGSFQNNKRIIRLIITSFYMAFGSYSDVSLILFITDNSDATKQELHNMMEEIKKELNIVRHNYLHKIITKTLSDNEILAAHNACNTYISLYDSGIESNINYTIAKEYGNTIIDESNTNMIYDIHQGYGDAYFLGELKLTTNSVSLSESMIRSLNTTTNNNNSYKTIDQILCP
jgi:hypothetical protein